MSRNIKRKATTTPHFFLVQQPKAGQSHFIFEVSSSIAETHALEIATKELVRRPWDMVTLQARHVDQNDQSNKKQTAIKVFGYLLDDMS
jgi:hypothetical protein